MQTELTEGKKWDAVKSHLKKHKGKYLLGAAAAGAGIGIPEIIGKHYQSNADSN